MKNREKEGTRKERTARGWSDGAPTRGKEWARWHERTEGEIAKRRRFDSWNEKGNRFRWWCDVFHSACSVCVCRGSPEAPEEPEGPVGIYEWIQVRNRCSHTFKHMPVQTHTQTVVTSHSEQRTMVQSLNHECEDARAVYVYLCTIGMHKCLYIPWINMWQAALPSVKPSPPQ